MSNTVGSIRRVTLDGLGFDAMSDANLNQIKGKYTNEDIVTSGKVVQKKTLRAQKIESVDLQANGEEAEQLRFLSERTTGFPMSYETANGDVYRAVGFINFEGHDTEAGKATIQMIPESIDGFTLFSV